MSKIFWTIVLKHWTLNNKGQWEMEMNKVTTQLNQLIAWREFQDYSTKNLEPGRAWWSPWAEEMGLGVQEDQDAESWQDRVPEKRNLWRQGNSEDMLGFHLQSSLINPYIEGNYPRTTWKNESKWYPKLTQAGNGSSSSHYSGKFHN